MTAYYNEFDPFAAAWLRELIKAGLIAPGEVDERSIEDVVPTDLAGFVQCHFFAGIGVWSYALRRARWPDDRPVWTGSCPCQPFSSAGKGAGFADERHLWPAFFHLISQCRPACVFGEQVSSRDGLAWLDLVQADLASQGYTSGAVDTPACGFGAPHIRQRLYWAADAFSQRPGGRDNGLLAGDSGGPGSENQASGSVPVSRVADAERGQEHEEQQRPSKDERAWASDGIGGRYPSSRVGNADDDGGRPGPTNGFWGDTDWLYCRDGKWRPVEPGTFPLVDRTPNRVGMLRGYGNAIVAPQAEAFIRAYMESNL